MNKINIVPASLELTVLESKFTTAPSLVFYLQKDLKLTGLVNMTLAKNITNTDI